MYVHMCGVCICICCKLHVCIGYYRCVLCLLACTCSRPILHRIGCSGFTKLGSGCFKICSNQPKHAHGEGEADHGRDEQGEEHPVISSRP